MADINEPRASHKTVRILLTTATPLENNDGQNSYDRNDTKQGRDKSDVGKKAKSVHKSINTEELGKPTDTCINRERDILITKTTKITPSKETREKSPKTVTTTNKEIKILTEKSAKTEATTNKEIKILTEKSAKTEATTNKETRLSTEKSVKKSAKTEATTNKKTEILSEKSAKKETSLNEEEQLKIENPIKKEIQSLTTNVTSEFMTEQVIKAVSSYDFKESVSLKLPDNASGFSHGMVTSFKRGQTSLTAKQKTKEHQEACEAMNRLETLQKQDLMKATRTRKLNSVAQSQLVCKLDSLEYYYKKQRKQQGKETRRLEDEIKKSEEENKDLSRISLPHVASPQPPNPRSLPHTPSRSTPPRTPILVQRSGTQDNIAPHTGCVRCKFNNKKHCRYFPCYLPLSYHSMGFKALEKSYTILHKYEDFMSRCEKSRPPSNVRARQAEQEAKEKEEMKKHSRLSIKDKERGLKHLIHQMRLKNDEKYKPREWATNYGAPLPRRMLSKPVVPVSESLINVESVK